MEKNESATELEVLKTKLFAVWTAGDFGEIARSYESGAKDFVKNLYLKEGSKVLDVACGTGNLSLPAASFGADVTGLDLAPNLIEQARVNAENTNLKIKFDVGDAESLPYSEASFDAVMTMFGAMFAPRPEVVAAELKRVCRSGGMIAMANWTPEGFIGQMLKLTGRYVMPPSMPSPILWGDEETVRKRFADGIAELTMARRDIELNFPFSPAQVVEHFRKFYGPTHKAFAGLSKDAQTEFRRDLENLWTEHNQNQDGTTGIKSEYLQVTAVRI